MTTLIRHPCTKCAVGAISKDNRVCTRCQARCDYVDYIRGMVKSSDIADPPEIDIKDLIATVKPKNRTRQQVTVDRVAENFGFNSRYQMYRHLYWKKGRGLKQIAKIISDDSAKQISWEYVRNDMDRAGIQRRKQGDYSRCAA